MQIQGKKQAGQSFQLPRMSDQSIASPINSSIAVEPEQHDANVDDDKENATQTFLASKFASLLPFDLVELTEAELIKRAGSVAMYDIDPKQWGRHFWNAFHIIAYAYPESPEESTQLAAFLFFDSLRKLLPCSKCRGNYVHNWLDFDIRKHLHTRTALIEWLILLHDSVNEETGKPPLDYAQLINRLTGTDDAVIVTSSEPIVMAFESPASTKSENKPVAKKQSPRRSHSVEPKPSVTAKKQVQTFSRPKKASIIGAATTGKTKESNNASRASTFARQVQVKPPKPCPSCSGKMTLTPSIF